MQSAVIVDIVRTPLGRRNGQFKESHPVDMAAHVLKALMDRNDFDPELIEDVIMGTCRRSASRVSILLGTRRSPQACRRPHPAPPSIVSAAVHNRQLTSRPKA